MIQKREIIWNIINASLAGALVFLGACTTGQITQTGVVAAIIAALAVIITRFKDYWGTEEREYNSLKMFNFLSP